MTDTTTPTVTEPATDATTAPAAATTDAATATAATDVPDWAKDPATALAEVQKARQEAAAARIAARDNAKAEARQQLLKDLGLVKDDAPADPAELARDLASKDTTIRDLQIRSALSDALHTAGAKPLARAAILGDGVLAGLDPSAADFDQTVAAKVADYISRNPELKTTQAASAGGADFTPGTATQTTFTRAQLRDTAFYQANKAEIEAAALEGRITS